MGSLNDTIGRLAARQSAANSAMKVAMSGLAPADPGVLRPFTAPGSNPGGLTAWQFVPADLPPGAPLVVVLHGCTQTAADYDRGAGWSTLAAEQGFALLFPEQVRGNNANLCFNWFVPADIRADAGEVLSIRQMIAAMIDTHGLDPQRVFITGLSAGGAMTAAMLATWPALFAGGAIIAGVPYGAAATVPEAFDRMRGHGLPAPAALAAQIRHASPDTVRWPRLSIWQGSADKTVDPANAEAIAHSWALLQGLDMPARDSVDGHVRRSWRAKDGSVAIESVTVAGLGHGTPIAAQGPQACGTPGPYMLEAGISSTRRIAGFWGIAPVQAAGAAKPAAPAAPAAPAETGMEAMINGALRQAGLIR
ncbi:extracellular catalytic domain type 1 short-chain-length polyhydroxyalkanoate depolymerase [Sandarakinorhabdus sp. DWP1-3-1]|uniref:extracellular catalytic domain type 1 short-chain-length polyhydroxyalkanoate depolymerase n=1 Tax=Sandarakinorhabdus sp. DWP1-3-1 TaxID=2804627 RepID=UPI003CFAE34B